MEFNEYELIKREGSQKLSWIRCYSCRKWVKGDEINDVSKLPEFPCPHCGETGEEIRKKQKELSQALGLDKIEAQQPDS